jgi:hypothetical protein
MKYTSNILQNHISMFQSIYVYLVAENHAIQLLSFTCSVIDFGHKHFLHKIFIYTQSWMNKKKHKQYILLTLSVTLFLLFYFIYSMYIFLAFFFTCELMFMSILFCAFFHRNKLENWTQQISLNQKFRRIHAKVHISTYVPYPIVFHLLCLYLLH